MIMERIARLFKYYFFGNKILVYLISPEGYRYEETISHARRYMTAALFPNRDATSSSLSPSNHRVR